MKETVYMHVGCMNRQSSGLFTKAPVTAVALKGDPSPGTAEAGAFLIKQKKTIDPGEGRGIFYCGCRIRKCYFRHSPTRRQADRQRIKPDQWSKTKRPNRSEWHLSVQDFSCAGPCSYAGAQVFLNKTDPIFNIHYWKPERENPHQMMATEVWDLLQKQSHRPHSGNMTDTISFENLPPAKPARQASFLQPKCTSEESLHEIRAILARIW